MSYRDTKRNTVPPTPRRRTTRRGIAPLAELDSEEPTAIGMAPLPDVLESASSSRPTRRDLDNLVPGAQKRTPRGEFSMSSLRGIGADTVSGSIERAELTPPPRRRRTTSMPVERVHLAHATKREITVIIGDQPLTLQRSDALALAQIIVTAFD